MPAFRGQGKRTVGRKRSGQSSAGHHQCLQKHHPYLQDRHEHGEQLSGDGENLSAGQEVLRWCARIGDIINVALASY